MHTILFILQCSNYLTMKFLIAYFYMTTLRITLDFRKGFIWFKAHSIKEHSKSCQESGAMKS